MKKITSFLIVSIFIVGVYSCKKDPVLSNSTAAGNWEGRFSNEPMPLNFNSATSATITSGGTITLADSAGTVNSTGVYNIAGDSLTTNLSLGSSTVTFRFKVSNKVTRFDGKWANSDGTASGLIYLNKK